MSKLEALTQVCHMLQQSALGRRDPLEGAGGDLDISFAVEIQLCPQKPTTTTAVVIPGMGKTPAHTPMASERAMFCGVALGPLMRSVNLRVISEWMREAQPGSQGLALTAAEGSMPGVGGSSAFTRAGVG